MSATANATYSRKARTYAALGCLKEYHHCRAPHMELSAVGFLASSLEIRTECYERPGFPTTANNGGSLLNWSKRPTEDLRL